MSVAARRGPPVLQTNETKNNSPITEGCGVRGHNILSLSVGNAENRKPG